MEATNQPIPVILDDEALAEIEARRPRTVHYNCPFVPLSETERDALCQTVRAAWAQVNEWESHRDGIIEAVKTAEARVEELEESNTALREQLAEAQEYSDTLARNYTSLEDWILRIRIKLGLQAKDADIETAIDKFQSRLAQVEKERDDLRGELERKNYMSMFSDTHVGED